MNKSEIIVRSDKSELVNFKKSTLAKDIRRELLRWKRDIVEMYPGADSLLEKGRIDGRLEALKYILGLIDVMIMVREEMENGSKYSKAD